MASNKVFITGVAGFLGSHLADTLLAAGYSVSGCDNLSGGYVDNVPKGVDFHQADCLDRKTMASLLNGVDIVYHLAAYAHEGLSVFSPFVVTQNTYGITLSVLSAAIENNVKRFVYCSSMARYGALPVLPFTEDMVPMPQDPYGIAKYAGELSVKNICETQGVEYVIAVPHNIIGSRQKYDDPYRNVASIMINLMLQGRQPIIYGDGEQKRSYSFVEDVVGCLVKMGFQPGLSGEIINVGPDNEFTSVNTLAKVIAELLDFKLEPIYTPDRPQEVRFASCSANKARRLLGYETKVDLKSGLREIVDYIKTRGPKPFEYHIDLEIVNDKTPVTWKNKMF